MYNDRLDTIEYQDRTTEYEYSEDTGLLESMAGNRYRWEDGNLISGGETVESVYLETENRMNIDIYGDCPFGLKLDGLASRDYVKSRICTEGGQTVTRTYEYEFTEDGMVDVMTVTTVSGENRDIKTYHINPDMFEQAFRPYAKRGDSVIYLCFSTGIAGTFNAANLAKEELQEEYPDFKITIIDTKCASMGFGLAVEKVLRRIELQKIHKASDNDIGK